MTILSWAQKAHQAPRGSHNYWEKIKVFKLLWGGCVKVGPIDACLVPVDQSPFGGCGVHLEYVTWHERSSRERPRAPHSVFAPKWWSPMSQLVHGVDVLARLFITGGSRRFFSVFLHRWILQAHWRVAFPNKMKGRCVLFSDGQSRLSAASSPPTSPAPGTLLLFRPTRTTILLSAVLLTGDGDPSEDEQWSCASFRLRRRASPSAAFGSLLRRQHRGRKRREVDRHVAGTWRRWRASAVGPLGQIPPFRAPL